VPDENETEQPEQEVSAVEDAPKVVVDEQPMIVIHDD